MLEIVKIIKASSVRKKFGGVTNQWFTASRQFVEIFLWAIIGRGGRRPGSPDPLPPSCFGKNVIKIIDGNVENMS